ncbi:pollen-specific leucine-rich repeat extensin-like protein 1 isoform X1 [Colias croceus]|uniref:pollen-specific leucine-rich repeat extensin-like protein 1 isoform X1 n=2 Tax=Colias crocea TaxID=72248 RepID=UPI001E27B0FA|nr:pollen-specific leucine-rich repeat extensin-like protein 1 isoform X1 [Colias croceus]
MCYIKSSKWTLIILVTIIRKANVQLAYPVYMPPPPPPMIAMPPPMQIPIIAIEIPEQTVPTTTTTTTTEKSVAIAIPVPVPMPVQVAVPAYAPSYCIASPRPKNCPPCPPCLCMPQCTPAFFSYCSPCHLKCRCRNPGDAPVPLPPVPPMPVPAPVYPMPMPVAPGPPPVVVVPMPPQIQPRPRRWKPKPKYSSSEESSDETSSDCDYLRRGKKFKRRKLRILRRKASSESENELVKPVLTYVSNNGEIKYEKKISNDEADQLLNGRDNGRRYKTVRVMTREDNSNKQQVVVMSNDEDNKARYKQVVLRNGPSHVLSSGKKELIFRPPGNKKISNLSVSFNIE